MRRWSKRSVGFQTCHQTCHFVSHRLDARTACGSGHSRTQVHTLRRNENEVPLRCAVRWSLRSQGPAPITAVSPEPITVWSIVCASCGLGPPSQVLTTVAWCPRGQHDDQWPELHHLTRRHRSHRRHEYGRTESGGYRLLTSIVGRSPEIAFALHKRARRRGSFAPSGLRRGLRTVFGRWHVARDKRAAVAHDGMHPESCEQAQLCIPTAAAWRDLEKARLRSGFTGRGGPARRP